MIPTSAVKFFTLVLYPTLVNKIMGMRNYREVSAIVKLTKPCTVSTAGIQMETLLVKESPGSHVSGAVRLT